MKKLSGLTLIELLIVIAIIGLISCIAYPSYQTYLLNTGRGNAKLTLIKAQLKQSSLHILTPSYSTDESALGLIDSDDYQFSVISASNTTYLMQAVAQGKQVNDTDCLILTIDQDSNQTPSDCW